MRPASIYGLRLRGTGILALTLSLAGCGQTGYLYLVMPATNVPPVTARPTPSPSTALPPAAPCVMVPTPTSNVAPVAAPFGGTNAGGVPYAPGSMPPPGPEPAPASITDILPPCVVYPSDYIPALAPATHAAPAAATHGQP